MKSKNRPKSPSSSKLKLILFALSSFVFTALVGAGLSLQILFGSPSPSFATTPTAQPNSPRISPTPVTIFFPTVSPPSPTSIPPSPTPIVSSPFAPGSTRLPQNGIILFERVELATERFDIYTVNPNDPGDIHEYALLNTTASERFMDWSLDGSMFIYKNDPYLRNQSKMYLANADGATIKELTPQVGGKGLRWSPDGKWIAYKSDTGEFEVYLTTLDGTVKRGLIKRSTETFFGNMYWSPNSKTLLYNLFIRKGFNGSVDDHWEIRAIDADGTNLRQIVVFPPDIYKVQPNPVWSPDSAYIAFYSELLGIEDDLEIYVISADGTNQKLISDSSAQDFLPHWSPDGASIAFSSDRFGNLEIFVMNPDGTNVRRLTQNNARDDVIAWSPDGTKILAVSFSPHFLYVMDADGSNVRQISHPSDAFGDIYAHWQPIWDD